MLNYLTLFGKMEVIKDIKLSLNFNVREKQAKPTETIIYCVVRVNRLLTKGSVMYFLLSRPFSLTTQDVFIYET